MPHTSLEIPPALHVLLKGKASASKEVGSGGSVKTTKEQSDDSLLHCLLVFFVSFFKGRYTYGNHS